jgi:hypothetical protein
MLTRKQNSDPIYVIYIKLTIRKKQTSTMADGTTQSLIPGTTQSLIPWSNNGTTQSLIPKLERRKVLLKLEREGILLTL